MSTDNSSSGSAPPTTYLDLEKQPLRPSQSISRSQRTNNSSSSRANSTPQWKSPQVRNAMRYQASGVNPGDWGVFPRLIQRDLPFNQSSNKVDIYNREKNRIPLFPSALKYILTHNWFHILLRWPTLISVSLLLVLWILMVVVFAYIYVIVDQRAVFAQCGLGKEGDLFTFSAAFAFSLETCTTVGYGLPNDSNNFFNPECRSVQITIALQMILSMLFNAFLTAFLWCSLARCEQRSAQVLFSNKAIIQQQSDGRWLFHCRMYDIDSSLPIVEAHIRLYCISWNDYDNQIRRLEQPQFMQTMRIIEPNDDLGSVIFPSVPFTATHHIDFFSPIAPAHLKEGLNYMRGHGLILREADHNSGSNAACVCPVCGETYETFINLERHIAFNKVLEDADEKLPMKGTHRDTDILTPILTKKFEFTKYDLRESLRGKEIVCIVEGIEPMVSGTFQALHSYKLEDIAFDSCFAPCVSQVNGKAVVDLDQFHRVVPAKSKSTYDSVPLSTSDSDSAHTRRSIFAR